MDIRSFFTKPSGAKSVAAKPSTASAPTTTKRATATHGSPAKPAKTPAALKPETPTRTMPSRRAKQGVVVLDDSDDEDVDSAVVAAKPALRKRVRRAVDDEDASDDDDDFAIVAKPRAPAKKSVKKEAASPVKRERTTTPAKATAAASVKAEVKHETPLPLPIKDEGDNQDDDDDAIDLTPIGRTPAGKAPPPCANCLDGLTFAFSGDLASLSRDDAIHLVKCCGASVTTSVSRNTKYLVIGTTLPNGDDVSKSLKYKDAIAKNIRMLSQNAFFNLITEATARVQARATATTPSSQQQRSSSVADTTTNMLWTDKYKPTRLEEMIGNIELGKRMQQWLADWDAVHVKGTKKIPFTTKLTDNRGAKTILLSGPPGIGKTTIANLVARATGFAVTEFNASDVRSKKMLHLGLKDVLGSTALQFGNRYNSASDAMHLAKRVIVMDEVDGMSGGDRGGTAELILLIKKSKTPIICICNDRQSPKVRSLANHSYDLRMRRPTKQQISKRLMEIGAIEGLTVEKNALEEAADRCGNDIRQLITQMQKWKLTKTSVTYSDLVDPTSQHNKDETLRLNPFSATQQIFQRDTSFDARNEAYFVDYDLMPLMVQENYIQSIMNNKNSLDEKLEAAMHASAFIAESDLVANRVRLEQRWDLLTKQAALNVAACVYSAGFIGHPEFSRWLGKNSSANKSKRLLSELSVRMRAHASGSREVIRMDYVPYMKEILLQKLLLGDDHIDEVIELLDACEISREDLTESMESFKFPGVKRHAYSELDTKAKTAFTRQYNKAVHKAQGVVESSLGSTTIKKGRGKASADADDDALPPASDAESEADDNDNDVDVSKFQKKPRGRPAAAAAGKASAPKRKAAANGKAKAAAPAKKRRA